MNRQDNKFLSLLFRHPRLIVFVIGVITIFFALQLPRAELDNNNIRFVPEDDEARITSNYIDDSFGSSLFILVALERKYGDVFDPAFLGRIREFNQRIEGFEITGEINSIVSSDYIQAEGDSIVVRKLTDRDFSGTPPEIADLKRRLLSWDIYRRALVSDDFTATQILIPLTITDETASRPEAIDSFIEIRDIAKAMFRDQAEVYVTGIPIISATINEAMRADLVLMIPLVVLVVLLVLFFSFRRLSALILPLITVLIAVIWSMGAMPLFGIKLSVVSSVLPVILVAVGSAYGIHVITHYLEDAGNGVALPGNGASLPGNGALGYEEHRLLVISVIGKIGRAVFLAAVTTLAGFGSFCFTSVLPIREFGFFSSFGVLVSFLTALTLIPSLLIIRGPRKNLSAPGARPGETVSAGSVARFFTRLARKKTAVLLASAALVVVSVLGITRLVIDNVFVEYFKTTTDISRSDRFIREKFGGSKIVSVVIRAETPEALLMPEALGALDDLGTYLEERVPEVGKVMGFTDLVKRINQVFNADESPEGLRPAETSVSAALPAGDEALAGFGNGEDFGFDLFADESFGDFSGFTGAETPELPAAPAAPSPEEEVSLSAGDIAGLLREAAGSGKDRSLSVNGLVREMEKLLNYEGAAYYEIPRDPARYGKTRPEELSRLVSNYLVLLSGSIDSYANDPLEPTAVKNTVQLRTVGDGDSGRAIESMRRYIEDNFPEGIEAIIGGSALVESSLNRLVVKSQLSSVAVSILLVFLIVALSNRSLIAGIVGIAPLSISILVNFAVMGFFGIKLNLGTSMVASVSIGIGIDYTIHYMEAYKREYFASANGAGEGFLLRTFAASGKAILINAVSVGLGFGVLFFSQFVMLKDLGLLIAITMGTSALVSLTVIPVLLSIIKPKFVYRELSNENV